MSARAFALATWRWLLEDVGLTEFVIGKLIMAPVSKSLVRRMPRPSGSGFVTNRILGRFTKPLWLRAVHAPGEQITKLPKFDKPMQVRMVIQEHDAKRAGLHWDVRLHIKGKAVSFALPKCKLPKIGERILAVRQPDHTEGYSDFEGTIPDGQFGAGTVRKVFDQEVDILKSDKTGLHIRVFDETSKRPQDFVFVDTGKDWLVIQKAIQPVERIEKHTFALRDAARLNELEDSKRFIAEVKMDGSHELIHVTKHGLRLMSHRISEKDGMLIEHTDKLPHLRDVVMDRYEGTVLHGELWHPKGANFVASVLNSSIPRARQLQDEHGPLKLKIFDMPQLGVHSYVDKPYEERRLMAQALIARTGSEHIHYIRGTRSNFADFYKRVIAGKEFRYKNHPTDGVILKDLNAQYKEAPWYKVKPHDEHDLKVVGFTQEKSILGRPKQALGALIVETPEGKRVNVGSGFTRHEREWLWARRKELPGEVVKVKFHAREGQDWTGPRFDGLHPEKSNLAGLMEIKQESK